MFFPFFIWKDIIFLFSLQNKTIENNLLSKFINLKLNIYEENYFSHDAAVVRLR